MPRAREPSPANCGIFQCRRSGASEMRARQSPVGRSCWISPFHCIAVPLGGTVFRTRSDPNSDRVRFGKSLAKRSVRRVVVGRSVSILPVHRRDTGVFHVARGSTLNRNVELGNSYLYQIQMDCIHRCYHFGMMTERSASKMIAYLSMEIAIDPAIPSYGGGLGILAGDMLRSAADLELPMVAVTLVYRKGYFRQHLDAAGNQTEEPDPWIPESVLQPVEGTVTVRIEDRDVLVRAWRYSIRGMSGFAVPVYLLDTDMPENSDWDRTLTDTLYGGDQHYRLCQEALLGFGGVSLLHNDHAPKHMSSYHMNEGHAAFLTLALLEEQLKHRGYTFPVEADVEAVRRRCLFTTHTPVQAGH